MQVPEAKALLSGDLSGSGSQSASCAAHSAAWASTRGPLGLSRGFWAGGSLATLVVVATAASIAASRRATASPARLDECTWASYRLPTTAVPLAYDVRWDLRSAFAPPLAFSGAATVVLRVLDPAVECVLLHVRALAITGAHGSGGGSGELLPLTLTPDLNAQNERVVVRLPTALRGLGEVRLHFNFSGALSDTVIGFYGSTYVNGSSNMAVPLVQTKFEPSFARTAFPCADEPALKATFNLSLAGVPLGYTALSNMPVRAGSRVPDADGESYSVSFDASPAMSTYQLTAVVAPMLSVSGTLAPAPAIGRAAAVPVAVWTMDRGNASLLPGADFAHRAALAVLQFYEATFLLPWSPLPKLDLVYLPAFPVGAMEQWGLITYTEAYLLSGANGSSSAASVVAHEIMHSYTGNLVTCAWWSSLWLQEGSATYWPYMALPALLPALSYDTTWRGATAGAMAEDAYASSQALTVATPVLSAGASYAVFNAITYDKGAAALAALRRRVEGCAGAGAFAAALAVYLRRYAFGAATPADLLAALAEAAPTCLARLAEEAAPLLAAPGVPLVTASWAAGGAASRSLRLTQSRFFASADSAAAAAAAAGGSSTLWTLPLLVVAAQPSAALASAAAAVASTVASAGGLSGVELATLPYDASSDGWLMLSNGSAAEYFRVLLPVEAYDAFAAAAARGDARLPPPDARAATLDDLFALAEAGAASAINMSYALVWAARWAGVDAAPAVRSALDSRVARLVALLVDDVPLSSAGNASARPAAATAGTPAYACLQAALRFARDRLGSAPAAIASLNASAVNANRAAAIASLAAPMDAANASTIISRVAAGAATRDIAWIWLKANWRALARWYGYRSTLATVARAVARGFTRRAYADDVAAWFAAAAAAAAAGGEPAEVVAAAALVNGTWQRAAESAAANAAWAASADAVATCALLLGLDGAAGVEARRGATEPAVAGERPVEDAAAAAAAAWAAASEEAQWREV